LIWCQALVLYCLPVSSVKVEAHDHVVKEEHPSAHYRKSRIIIFIVLLKWITKCLDMQTLMHTWGEQTGKRKVYNWSLQTSIHKDGKKTAASVSLTG
jgi:hypothetical protein